MWTFCLIYSVFSLFLFILSVLSDYLAQRNTFKIYRYFIQWWEIVFLFDKSFTTNSLFFLLLCLFIIRYWSKEICDMFVNWTGITKRFTWNLHFIVLCEINYCDKLFVFLLFCGIGEARPVSWDVIVLVLNSR